ncbi:pitrilysin family protein [Sulfurimonas sp. HSL-1716]|uniref:M16 family metallopeptidase n=1 Tax=Hydrocurvibacter sulfurireducens TaxID=3131937 RepID=UPI0031F7545D
MAATINYIEVKGVKIPLIFEEENRLPIVSMQLVFKDAGSVSDKEGLAKLSSKMMNEGTLSLGSNGFATALDEKAIQIGSSIGTETFVIEYSSLKEQFKEGMNLFSSLLKEPNITQKSLEKVKADMVGLLSAKENDYDYVASNALKKVLFEGTPLANPASGTIQSVKDTNLEEVENFLDKHIVLSNLIIVVGGDLTLEEAKQKAIELASNLQVGEAGEVKHYNVSSQEKDVVLKRETKQAYLYFGSPYDMKVGDNEYYKAHVATYILGTGGFGSRLMEEIRVKKGLAYSAYARVHVGKSGSYLTGYLQTKLESLDDAKATVKSVFENFVNGGVTEEELEQTKKFLLGSEPLRVETLSQRLSRTFMEFYKGQELGYSAKELELIKNLKLQDLNDFIKKHKEILSLSYAVVTK